jgi:hypothetical protein
VGDGEVAGRAFTGPGSLIPIVALQVPSKVQVCRLTRGLALNP